MRQLANEAQVAAAAAYEGLFVPALFAEWATLIADAAGVRPPARVVDVACGTGVLARTLHERVGQDSRVVGLDLNPGMLAVAREIQPRIAWIRGAAEVLPFEAASFDAVVCQFGLMLFADRHKALREMARVVRSGGWLMVAVWDRLEHNPAYQTEVEVLQEVAGAAAADAVRIPFSLGDRDVLRALFEDVGLSATVVSRGGTASFPSLAAMIDSELRGWLPAVGVHLTEEQMARVMDRAKSALASFVQPDGRVLFETSAHVVTVTIR